MYGDNGKSTKRITEQNLFSPCFTKRSRSTFCWRHGNHKRKVQAWRTCQKKIYAKVQIDYEDQIQGGKEENNLDQIMEKKTVRNIPIKDFTLIWISFKWLERFSVCLKIANINQRDPINSENLLVYKRKHIYTWNLALKSPGGDERQATLTIRLNPQPE